MKELHGPTQPHHATYGLRIRRFDKLDSSRSATPVSPKVLKSPYGSAAVSAGAYDSPAFLAACKREGDRFIFTSAKVNSNAIPLVIANVEAGKKMSRSIYDHIGENQFERGPFDSQN